MKNKVIPRLRFKADDGSDYPDWEKRQLGNIARRITRKNDVNNTNVLTISAQHGLINQEDFFHKQIASKDLSGYILLKNGEFAYNKSYSKGYPLGVIKRLNLYDQGVLSVLYICFALENVSLDFYMYYFESGILNQQIYKIAQEGVRNHGLLNISATDFFTDIFVYLPYSLEQQKIAEFLTVINKLMLQTKQQLELMKQYKQSIMQQIFSQQLRFKADDGSDYPNWEEKRLGDICCITTGSSNRIDSNLDGQYVFFDRSEDIRTSNKFLFDGEAVIIPGEGQSFIPKYFVGKFDLHQRAYAIMNLKCVHMKFIYYLMQCQQEYLLSNAVGSTVKSLRLPIFKKMPILMPHTLEQQKIADFLTSIDTQIKNIALKLEQTELYKKSLLQQMLI